MLRSVEWKWLPEPLRAAKCDESAPTTWDAAGMEPPLSRAREL